MSGIEIAVPPLSLYDDPLELHASGLTPGCDALFQARLTTGRGLVWESSGRFAVRSDGTVTPGAQHATDGTYTGIDDHGLLWSARGKYDEPFGVPPWIKLTVEVESDGETATTEVVRSVMLRGVEPLDVNDDVCGTYYAPTGRSDLPAVVVVGGTSEPPLYLAACLASHGFAAFCVRLFGKGSPPLPSRFAQLPVEYVTRCVDWISNRAETADGVGILAVSSGSIGALLASQREDRVRGVAVLSGPTVVLPARPIGQDSAWTIGGKTVPAVTRRRGARSFFRRSATASQASLVRALLEDADLSSSELVLDAIDAPLLVAYGQADEFIPSEAIATGLEHRIRRAGDVTLSYKDAGHITRLPGLPSYPSITRRAGVVVQSTGGSTPANAVAIRESWREVIEFFRRHIGPAIELPREEA